MSPEAKAMKKRLRDAATTDAETVFAKLFQNDRLAKGPFILPSAEGRAVFRGDLTDDSGESRPNTER